MIIMMKLTRKWNLTLLQYDEIEICQNSAEAHYKSAIQIRNRQMIDRSDLIVCCIEHNSGGAYQTIQYARNQKKEIINLADLSTR